MRDNVSITAWKSRPHLQEPGFFIVYDISIDEPRVEAYELLKLPAQRLLKAVLDMPFKESAKLLEEAAWEALREDRP